MATLHRACPSCPLAVGLSNGILGRIIPQEVQGLAILCHIIPSGLGFRDFGSYYTPRDLGFRDFRSYYTSRDLGFRDFRSYYTSRGLGFRAYYTPKSPEMSRVASRMQSVIRFCSRNFHWLGYYSHA